MKRLISASILFLITLLVHPQVLATSSIELTNLKFEQLKQQQLGQKWLLLLWSVDCPPCMKELALVQQLKHQQNDIAVIMINTDTQETSAKERNDILQHFELTQLNNFHFAAGREDQQRYHIDPQWFGELPRSYFVDEAGEFHGKSGLISKEFLSQWLLSEG